MSESQSTWVAKGEITLPGNVSASLHESTRTGLQVAHVSVPGPLVKGFFTLRTESHDDDGLPHTLEHIVFLGSARYPYKGVLDKLANRSLARGTNAWTDTDHTAYTLTTAGPEGFAAMLPIFLDHLLFPTMTDEGVVTEVHHVTGEGEDAGVVYCEMQARENTPGELAYFAALHALFPDSGYEANTGGRLANLRELEAQTIRDYHAKYYVPENMCLIVAGCIDLDTVLASLVGVEDDVVAARAKLDAPYTPLPRPWTAGAPEIQSSVSERILFPDASEEVGEVLVGFRGPAFTEPAKQLGLKIALDYLVETAVAPLQLAFVEREDPLAGSVHHWAASFDVMGAFLSFDAVPKDQLDGIQPAFESALAAALEEEWDEGRLTGLLVRRKLKYLASLEQSAHDSVAGSIIDHFLWAPEGAEFSDSVNRLAVYAELEDSYGPKEYMALIREYVVDAHVVTVVAEPSAAHAEALRETEEARVAAQKEALGVEGLKAKGELLAAAMAVNDAEIPGEVLESVPCPSISSVPLISVQSVEYSPESGFAAVGGDKASCGLADDLARASPSSSSPLWVDAQFDSVPSSFVGFSVYVDTQGLSVSERLYLPLLADMFFEAPTSDMSHEEVVEAVALQTIKSRASLGVRGRTFFVGESAHKLVLSVATTPELYGANVELMSKLVFAAADTVERVRTTATRMVAEAMDLKRNGRVMATMATAWSAVSQSEHNGNVSNLVVQETFLSALAADLADPESEAAAARMAELAGVRAKLQEPVRQLLHVVGDLSQDEFECVGPLVSLWGSGVVEERGEGTRPGPRGSLGTFPSSSSSSSSSEEEGARGESVVISLAACESTFVTRSFAVEIGFEHEQYAALLVAIEALTTMEGPFWTGIRGQGLSYGYGIRHQPWDGFATFALTRASQPDAAYEAAVQIVEELTGAEEPFDRATVEAAISSVLFTLVDKEPTIVHAAEQAFIKHQLRQLPASWMNRVLNAVSKVTVEDIRVVMTDVLLPMFKDEKAAHLVFVTNPGMEERVVGVLEGLGREGEVVREEGLEGVFAI